MSIDSNIIYLEQEKLGMKPIYLGPNAIDKNPRLTPSTVNQDENIKKVYSNTVKIPK